MKKEIEKGKGTYLGGLSITKEQILEEKKKREKKKESEKKLQELQEREKSQYQIIQSTQSFLPIRDIIQGIVITKDERYIKIIEFEPQNFHTFSNIEQNKISEDFYHALRIFPIKVQFKIFMRKAKIENLLEYIDNIYKNEKNESCRIMQQEYRTLIQETALKDGVSRRFFVIIEYNESIESDGSGFKDILHGLNQVALQIRSQLENMGNRYIPSCETDIGLHTLFFEILNRKLSETETFDSRIADIQNLYKSHSALPSALEFISPQKIELMNASHLVIDGKYYTFAYIMSDGYPSIVNTGWINLLINTCEGIDIDIFFTKINREKVEMQLGRMIRINRSKQKDTSDTSTESFAVQNLISSGFYILKNLANGEDFYNVNVLITITADNLKTLNFRYKELERMLKTNYIKLKRLNFQMEESFISSLPLCSLHKDIARKSKRNVLSRGAASFYPFISSEIQDEKGIMLGVNQGNNSLVCVDVFGNTHANANGAILGQSGYGKTFTAQLFAIRMRLQNIQTFIITPIKGLEDYKNACDMIDGQYVYLGAGSQYSINIFDIRMPDFSGFNDSNQYQISLLAKKVESLHAFMHIVVKDLQQEEEQLLDKYFYELYESFGITDDNESIYIPNTKEYKEFPLLGDFYHLIEKDERLERVCTILRPLVYGSLSSFNRHTNIDLDNKYIIFDMNGIKDRNLILSMFVTLDFVWSKIKENRLEKKAVFIDEAWKLIGTESNEMTAEYVKEIFKTIRGFGGAAFVMTQEISDFFALKNGEYGKAIIGNSDTKICLHLEPPEAKMMAEILNLSKAEYKKITKLRKGSGLLVTAKNKLFIDFKASYFETNLITTDPNLLRENLKKKQ